MNIVTKSVEATIEPVADESAANPNGEFVVRLATPGTDREGDDLEGKGWQLPLPEHITFDTDHGMSVATMVGSGAPALMTDGSIEVKGGYASTEHAQDTRKLVNEGHIRTVSVTFLQRTTKSAGKTTVSRELLNGSFVAIPANPKAVVLSSKGLDLAAVERQTEADTGDERVALTVVVKGIAGSVEDLGERVRAALRECYGANEYPWVRATFLSDATNGTVVYELDGPGSQGRTLARSFSDDGKSVTLAADTREVSLVTSVVDVDDAGTTTDGAKSVATDDTTERAIALLTKAGTGMTRAAAMQLLGIDASGATVATEAPPGQAAVADTVAAADTAAATDDATDAHPAAASHKALNRARALVLSITDDAAG